MTWEIWVTGRAKPQRYAATTTETEARDIARNLERDGYTVLVLATNDSVAPAVIPPVRNQPSDYRGFPWYCDDFEVRYFDDFFMMFGAMHQVESRRVGPHTLFFVPAKGRTEAARQRDAVRWLTRVLL